LQCNDDMPDSAPGVRLGSGTSNSLVAYISISEMTGRGHKPAVAWIGCDVLAAATPDMNAWAQGPAAMRTRGLADADSGEEDQARFTKSCLTCRWKLGIKPSTILLKIVSQRNTVSM